MDRLKIALKSEKQKTGAYPAPGDAFQLINSGAANVAAYQGFFNEKVANNEITKYPTDPETGTHYPYSTTKNRQAFQLATVVEDADPWKAYVEGDYKSVAMNVLPSLMLAMNGPAGSQVEIADGVVTAGSAGSDNRKKFILHGGTANLPYDANGNPVANSTLSFVEILSASGATKTGSARFRTCLEIKEGGAFIGSGEYQVLTESGTVENMLCTGTTFDGACGSANGVPATSVPTSNFCSVGNATAVSGTGGWTWDCVGSDGGSTAHCSADLVSYVVSGSFGTNASGATVSVCGGSAIADSFGNFSKNTVLY